MKKNFAVLTAACLVFGMVGCQKNNYVLTGQEQISTELNNETLAESEERDYKIEDILKNDLKIDGIPISLPCTLNELLEMLGDDYSVDEDEIKDHFCGEADIKDKYFTGELLVISLYYKGTDTYCSLWGISDPDKIDFDTINIDGCLSGFDKGVISISGLDIGDSMDKCLEKYGNPNITSVTDRTTYLEYVDEDCSIQIVIENNIVDRISIVDFNSEEL